MGHHVRLVQDDPDLVVLRSDRFNGVLELVRDVQFVRIEDQDDPEEKAIFAMKEFLRDFGSFFLHLSAFSANHLRTPVKS